MRVNLSIIYNALFYSLISSSGLYLIKRELNTVVKINLQTGLGLFRNSEFVIGFILYLVGFVYWFIILHKFNLSLAFPVAATSLMIMTTLLSVFCLREHLISYNWLGLMLMVIGIFLCSLRGASG
jgi:multidrug transporter EmrE-like cation transporter